MNYRHSFHAGNFGDVLKHALLVGLIRGFQKKEKGFLFLDTHAGRGRYDLADSSRGDSLERSPEWPDGIGRLWDAADLPESVAAYVALVRDYDRDAGNPAAAPRFYPGSPLVAKALMREQDRMALCEKQPDECEELRYAVGAKALAASATRSSVHELDGYEALRAMLPAPERRALVLIDPPYEALDEAEQICAGLAAGLKRAPASTFAIWYPLTQRMRPDDFYRQLLELKLPPTLVVDLVIASEESGIKVRGCGLAIINPPWPFEPVAREVAGYLADKLAQGSPPEAGKPGANGAVTWLVPET